MLFTTVTCKVVEERGGVPESDLIARYKIVVVNKKHLMFRRILSDYYFAREKYVISTPRYAIGSRDFIEMFGNTFKICWSEEIWKTS